MDVAGVERFLIALIPDLFTQRYTWEDITELTWFLVAGAIAGFLAGMLMRDGGFGIVGNVVIGVIGSFIGAFLLKLLGITSIGGFVISPIGAAFIGALVLLFFINLIKRA
jgi:uncharacterized membrane protein YeaQ/YmgE (transglycosylase-associated protein family)